VSKKSKRRDGEELNDRKGGREVAAGRPVVSDVPGPTPNDTRGRRQGSSPGESEPEEDIFERAVTLVLERGQQSDVDLAPKLGVSLDEARKLLKRMQAEQLVQGPVQLQAGGPETRLYTALCTLEQRAEIERRYRQAVEWLLARGTATNVELAASQSVDAEDARGILRRMRKEGLVGAADPVAPDVEQFTAQTSLAEWRALRGLTPEGESGDPRQVERDKSDRHAVEVDRADLGDAGLVGVSPVELLSHAFEVATGAAWSQILGDEAPSGEQVQAWLDRVHQAVLEREGGAGHFGSFEKNATFARLLRLLFQDMAGFQILDPKTGLPGMLYHRKAGRAPCGQFMIQVKRPGERREIGYASAKLPPLKVVTSTSD